MNEYTKQAEQFLADTGTTFGIEFLRTGPYFAGETEIRDIYQFTLTNARGSYSATFGDSTRNTKRRAMVRHGTTWLEIKSNPQARKLGISTREEAIAARHAKPNAYDILAGISSYTEPVFSDWCAEYGYTDAPMLDYPKLRAMHDACLAESKALERMFTPEQLEQLGNIS